MGTTTDSKPIPDSDPPPYTTTTADATTAHCKSVTSFSNVDLTGPLIVDGLIRSYGGTILHGFIEVKESLTCFGVCTVDGDVTVE